MSTCLIIKILIGTSNRFMSTVKHLQRQVVMDLKTEFMDFIAISLQLLTLVKVNTFW